jgi:uncharacterized protein (TIGR02246 family)
MTNLSAAVRTTATAFTILIGIGGTATAAINRSGPSTHGHDRLCARQFGSAVEAYVETTAARDAAGFNGLLSDDVTVVFANGGVLYGKDQVAPFIDDFFADTGWSQTFTELTRHVEDCRSGFVLFDSVYSVPADNRVSPLVIGVTFTYAHGRWLVLHNQDSNGPAST